MSILESGEMYLETILLLKKKKDKVRSIDIAKELNYSRPSVSRAVGILKEKGYITIDEHGIIDFTKTGKETVDSVYEKHVILTKCFTMLGIPEDIAEEDACRVEHVISDITLEKIKEHIDKIETHHASK